MARCWMKSCFPVIWELTFIDWNSNSAWLHWKAHIVLFGSRFHEIIITFFLAFPRVTLDASLNDLMTVLYLRYPICTMRFFMEVCALSKKQHLSQTDGFRSSTWETEASSSLWVRVQPGQVSQGHYTKKPKTKQITTTKNPAAVLINSTKTNFAPIKNSRLTSTLSTTGETNVLLSSGHGHRKLSYTWQKKQGSGWIEKSPRANLVATKSATFLGCPSSFEVAESCRFVLTLFCNCLDPSQPSTPPPSSHICLGNTFEISTTLTVVQMF